MAGRTKDTANTIPEPRADSGFNVLPLGPVASSFRTIDGIGQLRRSARSFAQHTRLISVILLLAVLAMPVIGLGQGSKKSKPAKSPKKSSAQHEPTLSDRVKKAKAEVVVAANAYKESLEKLLVFQQSDVKVLADLLEKRKALLAESIISKKEVEDSERAVATAQAKVADTKRQLGEADNLIAEATAEEKLSKIAPGAYVATAVMIRYNGPAHWVLTDAAKVQSFFSLRFNHALPISAYGQTAVHDHLGFDHHNSLDVAVNPDSSEGQTLMSYLRGLGIPFIAFRHAVAGSATGAHIHIGYPSKRVAK